MRDAPPAKTEKWQEVDKTVAWLKQQRTSARRNLDGCWIRQEAFVRVTFEKNEDIDVDPPVT